MRALAVALVLLATPAQANMLLDARDWWHCRLYPSHERCRPPAPAEPVQAPAPAPLPAPVVVAPPPEASPQPPPRAAPAVVHRAKPKAKPRVKTKAIPTKPKRKRVSDAGPDLPWPCWMVRLNAGRKTCGELAAEGQRRGITLTPKQHYQAAVCIGRCFPS